MNLRLKKISFFYLSYTVRSNIHWISLESLNFGRDPDLCHRDWQNVPIDINSILFRILFLRCSANFFPFQRWNLSIDAKPESFINFAEYPWAFARPRLISSEMFLFKIRSRYARKNSISLFQGGFRKFPLQPWNKLNTFRSPRKLGYHHYSLYHAFSVQNTEAKLIFEKKFHGLCFNSISNFHFYILNHYYL